MKPSHSGTQNGVPDKEHFWHHLEFDEDLTWSTDIMTSSGGQLGRAFDSFQESIKNLFDDSFLFSTLSSSHESDFNNDFSSLDCADFDITYKNASIASITLLWLILQFQLVLWTLLAAL